jgi:hypothetical protein
MSFDPQAIFANLAEKEKFKGHHSAEGRTIRMLSRAMSGWSTNNLSAGDVLVLCDQAMEDWLKSRLEISGWSTPSFPTLLEKAVLKELISRTDAVGLQKIHNARSRAQGSGGDVSGGDAQSALELCIQIVEKFW